MKNTLLLVTLNVVALTTTVLALDYVNEKAMEEDIAIKRQAEQKVQELMEKGKTDDAAIQEAIRVIPLIDFDINPVDYLTGLIQETEIPSERVVKVVADMIRKKLVAIEKDKPDSVAWDYYLVFSLFRAFPDYDILPIVKESLKSKDEHIRFYALGTYASRTGEKSIPLLRDIIENKRLSEDYRNQLYSHLEKVSAKFQSENKTSDVKAIIAFLNEMKQAEKPKAPL